MRVLGNWSSSPYTRFGFSPQAILSPCGAPGNFIAWYVVAGTFLSVTPRPPIRFAEPGRICSEVTPPWIADSKPGSWGHTLCSTQTFAVTGSVDSLPSLCASTPGLAEAPMCECTSIRPGVTHRPLASITCAPEGEDNDCPTAVIRPFSISTSPPSMRVPVPVRIVALRIRVGGLGSAR